jgi:hypothetical protein
VNLDDTITEHQQGLASLAETALRVKAERDEAIALLRESLIYSFAGKEGPFKTRVKEFLGKVR